MMFRTHLPFSLLFGSLFLGFAGINTVLFFILVAAGSLIPDMDHKNSWINNRLKISKVLPYFTEHRGVMHSLILGFGMLAFVWIVFDKIYAVPLFIGFVSHILIDGLTPSGVNFLHPLGELHLRGFIDTGSWKESIIFLLILIFSILQINRLYIGLF